jgi:glycosyl hydrolase family 115
VIYANDIAASSIHGSWSKVSDGTAAAGIKLVTPDNGVSNTSSALASPTDYVDVTFSAQASTPYTLWLRLQATANSKYNDSVYVQFSDAQAGGGQVYPINSTSGLTVNLATDSTGSSLNGWGWQNAAYWLSQATTVTFPTTGTHTLRIQVREDGVQFDQIVLSPTTYLNSPPGPVSGDATIVPKS